MYLKRILVLLLAVVLVASCVRTQKRSYASKISPEKELETRVQVAIAYLEEGVFE